MNGWEREKVWLVTTGKKSSDFGQRFVMPRNRSGHYGVERTGTPCQKLGDWPRSPNHQMFDHPLRQLLCSRRQRTHNSLSEGCLKRMRYWTADSTLQYSKQTDAPHRDMGCPLPSTLFLYAFEIIIRTTLCHQLCTYVGSLFYLTAIYHFLSARVY